MGLINWKSKEKADKEWDAKKARKERRSEKRIEAERVVAECRTIQQRSSVIFTRILGDETKT